MFLTITARSDDSAPDIERDQDAYTKSLSDLEASRFQACDIFGYIRDSQRVESQLSLDR